ncbi:hypothetical protein EG028_04310 [Chitinophaga barathri]|uniref:Lipocalin-like domain-containing protein n=2 Tax=Chitinophaga barathri TaxID=1647451 RepID=A0A3N4MFP0_9BACT|nr:hypothetical protein EG028_04310 [Chitinophaga barathri]
MKHTPRLRIRIYLIFDLMKILQKLYTAAAITSLAAAVSFTAPSAGRQAPFIDKYWVYESSTVVPAVDLDMDGKPDNSISVLLEECQEDDARMFKGSGKIVEDYGKNKCGDDEVSSEETGDWTYNAATRQLSTKDYNTDEPEILTLREISASRMVLVRVFRSNKGEHTITAVYKTR